MRIKVERTMYTKDGDLYMDNATYKYICRLEDELSDAKRDNFKLEAELNAIKPVVESKKLSPAVSVHCDRCRFVVRSSWNNDIIGCCKNNVCEGFLPKED